MQVDGQTKSAYLLEEGESNQTVGGGGEKELFTTTSKGDVFEERGAREDRHGKVPSVGLKRNVEKKKSRDDYTQLG